MAAPAPAPRWIDERRPCRPSFDRVSDDGINRPFEKCRPRLDRRTTVHRRLPKAARTCRHGLGGKDMNRLRDLISVRRMETPPGAADDTGPTPPVGAFLTAAS